MAAFKIRDEEKILTLIFASSSGKCCVETRAEDYREKGLNVPYSNAWGKDS